MLLITLDSSISVLESIDFLDEKVKVYNFEVEGKHNYYVCEQKILVHNNCGLGAIIESIPSSLKQLNMCKAFSSSLAKKMTAQGLKGEMVVLKSDTGFIWSETLGKTISTNGDHVGIKVGNMVYDNMFPKGIPYNQWLKDLGVGFPGMRAPVLTPF